MLRLYFLACGQVVEATQKKCSHTDRTGGRFVCNQRQAKSAFHVYTGHTSQEAACYSITLFPMSVWKDCTEICYSCMLHYYYYYYYYYYYVTEEKSVHRKKLQCCSWVVYVDLYFLFLCFAKWSVWNSGSTFVSVLVLLSLLLFVLFFCSLFSCFTMNRASFMCPRVIPMRNNWRKSCRSQCYYMCGVTFTWPEVSNVKSAISELYLPFPASFLLFPSVLFRNISVTTSGLEFFFLYININIIAVL